MNIEGLSLDQLRAAAAVMAEGSFSGAARRLGRAQSAISYAVAQLEAQLGLALFDRSGHKPQITTEGRALAGEITAILARADGLKARARGLVAGLEAELPLVFDSGFPMAKVATALAALNLAFPSVGTRLLVDHLGAAQDHVRAGRAMLAVAVPVPALTEEFRERALAPVRALPVAAAGHPLARQLTEGAARPLTRSDLADHVQLVLADRSERTQGRDMRVYSANAWRIADHGARLALVRQGVGWCSMPEHMVADDIAAGRLVVLEIEGLAPAAWNLPIAVFHLRDAALGPAARWLLDWLMADAAQALGQPA